jgi:tetratricopeptide (TPR) repeat protein
MAADTNQMVQENVSENTCLFSLRIDNTEFEEIPQDTVDNIITLLKQYNARIINVESTEVNAAFQTIKDCTQTAKSIIQNIVQTTAESNRTTYFVKTGLHLIDETDLGEEQILKHFSSSIAARNKAEPNEIIITSELYSRLPSEAQETCKIRIDSPDSNSPFYSLSQKTLHENKTRTIPIIPSAKTLPDRLACFYCGTSLHSSADCPSKPIQRSTNYIDKLGYVPLPRIIKMFHDNFSEIVRPLEKGSKEYRFETLYNEKNDNPLSVYFFSFYEISEMFQLRALNQLYYNTSKNPQAQKTGSLKMGLDCLRVSRFSEAEDWLKKALVENHDDYRPIVSQGFLYLEQERFNEALSRFRIALSFPLLPSQKAPLHLLCARIHEISDALLKAKQEAANAVSSERGWNEAEYYYAVILAKLGDIDGAVKIFKKLSYDHPRYLLMALIDPSINTAREKVIEFLNSEISQLRSRALESYTNIKKNNKKYEQWLGLESKDQKRTYELYQKASGALQNESISGLADIPAFDLEIKTMIKRSISGRKNDLHKKISKFGKKPSFFEEYLYHYPYKFAVSQNNFETGKKFKSLYEKAINEVKYDKPQNLENAQKLLEELVKTSRTVTSIYNRLENTKTLLFAAAYLFRMLRFFTVTGIISAVLFIVSLALLRSVFFTSALKTLDYISFFRYGFSAGIFVGTIATALWIRRNL